MLAHVIDNPAPSTIILISGDRDFAYALSILRLRCYRVVLITLPNAHQCLKAQASLCFDWVSDVLEPVDATLYQSPSPLRRKISSPSAHDGFDSDFKGYNPSRSFLQESHYGKSASSVEFLNDFRDETRRSDISRTPPKRGATHDSLPPETEKSNRQPTASSLASDAFRNGPESPARVIYSPVASSCHTDLSGSIGTPLTMMACGSNSSITTPTPNTSVGSTLKLATHASIVPSRPIHGALRESTANSMSIESAMQMLRAERELRGSSSQQQGLHPRNNVTQSPLTVEKVNFNGVHPGSPPTHSDISPPANVTATLPVSTPPFMPPSSLDNATVTTVTQSPATNPRRPTPLLTVPDKFKVLIQCLKSHRSRACLRPLCSKISSEITHNGTTYRQAGVSEFGEYAAMAEMAGIVELGGSGSTAWIALKAPWYNARLS